MNYTGTSSCEHGVVVPDTQAKRFYDEAGRNQSTITSHNRCNCHLQPSTIISHIRITDIEVDSVIAIVDIDLLSLTADPFYIISEHFAKCVYRNHGVTRIYHNRLLVGEIYAFPVQHNNNGSFRVYRIICVKFKINLLMIK